ncbi:MAG: hypothetical protein ACPG8K_03545, partial [Crocinitomicaceae bacterium]
MNKTSIWFLILCLCFGQGCKSVASNPSTVADAEKKLAKERKKREKEQKKAKKEAQKYYWSLQTKEAKKSVKKNRKR